MKEPIRTLVAVLVLASAMAATPAPSPQPSPDAIVTKIARQQFVAWQAGSPNSAQYAPAVVSKLTPDKISEVSRPLAALGPLIGTEYVAPFSAADIPAGAHGYIYNMHCANGSIYLWLVLDPTGKIATIFFKNTLDVETIERPAEQIGSPPRP